ncbi:MAG: hypothetical protein ACHREM_21550 [Polyangiales bacterium]
MRISIALTGVWSVVASLVSGCGGLVAATTDASPNRSEDAAPIVDSGEPALHDAGFTDVSIAQPDTSIADTAPSETVPPVAPYPAFSIAAPTAINAGGPVLSKPTIVTITWAGDDLVTELEGFGDEIGGTKYWAETTSEYGVGPATSGPKNHVRLPTKITTITDVEAEALVVKSASDPKASGWPAPTPDTLYFLYFSQGVSFMITGGDPTIPPAEACASGIGGYHSDVKLTDGTRVAYAVVPRCTFATLPLGFQDTTTSSASHEIAEAATDPFSGAETAYSGFDDRDLAWTAWQLAQTEIGDDCEFFPSSDIVDPETHYEVQALWSNKSFLAGHAGCVPAAAAPYFNVTPLNLSLHAVHAGLPGLGAHVYEARTIHIPYATTGILEIGFYSDAPRGDWTLTAVEGNTLPGTAAAIGGSGSGAAYADGNLTISIDHPTGKNGDKASVSITVHGIDTMLGANLLTLVSTDVATGVVHYFPVIVSSF